MRVRFIYTVFIGWALAVTGCSDHAPQKRTYQERVIEAPPVPAREVAEAGPPMHDIPMPVHTQSDAATRTSFEYDVPEGWTERPGTGMRLATLVVEHGGETAECAITVLGRDAGTLEANIRRWMGQVDIVPPEGEAMQTYLESLERFQTNAGLHVILIDFSPFVEHDDAMSTLISMIPRGDQNLFLRLNGTQALLDAERERFLALSRSVR